MASVVVTLKIMPAGPDKELDKIKAFADERIREFMDEKHKDSEIRAEEEPIGFGLKALKLTFVYEESMGTTDELEEKLAENEDIESVEAVDVRRAIG